MRLLVTGGAGFIGSTFVRRVMAHDRRYSVDWTKIRTQLGYTPQVDFSQGLADTVRWYAEHRDWWEPLKAASVTVPR